MTPPPEHVTVVRAITVITGTVVGLTFLFGFGNVLDVALRLGVPVWVAPLVAPAVDLSIVGLLIATRRLALVGAHPATLRPARRLLIFASLVTLALNIADPIAAAQYGKAAFDAVGPVLLVGWAEVGPDLLRALTASGHSSDPETTNDITSSGETQPGRASSPRGRNVIDGDLLEQAREEDSQHWDAHRRPISAETLRRKLRISADRSRRLVTLIRAEPPARPRHELAIEPARVNEAGWPEPTESSPSSPSNAGRFSAS